MNQKVENLKGKLIVSCQALSNEPLHSSFIMGRMALAAKEGGAFGIRANTKEDIKEIQSQVDLPIIGIVKRDYEDSDIYITPTMKEIDELMEVKPEIIAMDATISKRPGNKTLDEFFKEAKEKYPDQLWMADCSTVEEALHADELGFDFIGTTMVGYTPQSKGDKIEANISPEAVQALTKYFVEKGVKGVYVNGSSGECIYQSVEDRKIVLENVMKAAEGKLTVIAHVACNNTKDSQELAKHAESLGVDAIAAIPPIYFHLPEYAIAKYWNDISAAAPNTDFVIYNIPQLAGVALTQSLFAEMRKNPNVIGVKNSSMPVQDIQMFKQAAGPDYIIFNGPDEQFMSGRVIGAEGAIGGTYGVMPELYLKLDDYVKAGDMEKAREIQYACDEIIYKMCSAHGNMYAVIKAILKINEGLELGGVREPLPALIDADMDIVKEAAQMICDAKKKYL